jgi:hypothetical protein
MIKKLTLALILGGVFLAACGPPPPDIALLPESADLGEVRNGEILTIEAEVLNNGGTPLKIEQISTTCGCTTADIEQRTIPAGSTATLTITFDSGAHGSQFDGPIRRAVFLWTNDPDEAEVTFTFSADVRSADP